MYKFIDNSQRSYIYDIQGQCTKTIEMFVEYSKLNKILEKDIDQNTKKSIGIFQEL